MNTKRKHLAAPKIVDIVIATITWLAIVLQALNSTNLANTFSYFTVLTNLLIALSLTIVLLIPASSIGRFFSNISVQSALTTYIIIVSAIYNLAIRETWSQPAIEFIYNNTLHVFTPLLYLARWIFYIPKRNLKWYESIKWLSFPFLYLVYSIIRGELTNWYPYFFVDLRKLSYMEAGINILVVLVSFLFIGSILVLLDHLIFKSED